MFTLITVFLITLIVAHWFLSKPRNYPPGPFIWPILGSVFSVESKNFHLYMEKVKQFYGPVIGFKFGPNYVVGVAGSKEAKEVLSREEFQGRPSLAFVKPGIMFNDGQSWLVQRKFTFRNLRDFGFGKLSLEALLLEEFEDCLENVFYKQEILQVNGLFTVSVINVLWAMIEGKRYSHKDKEFKILLDCLQRRFRSGNVTGGVSNMFPLLRKLFPNLKWFKNEIEIENLLDSFFQKAIEDHKKTKTENPCDFMDVYLSELNKKEIHPSFSEQMLKNVCSDIFGAGSESVSNTLGFCLLYCVLYPEWQDELYEEIQSFNNSGSYLVNKKRFPKIEAFLSEVSRCNTIASIAVPHRAVMDTTLNGYFIPKNTMLLISLWSILQDVNYWKDPKNFRPQRFLNENGEFISNSEWLPVFGIGKRICPGESVARSIVFVYFIELIRHFKFEIPEGHPKPPTLCLPGFTNAPQPFEVKVTRRSQL